MKRSNETAHDRLLAAAVNQFALQGFDGTTTRSIVAQAGSSLSVLQECFGSKQNLYQQVMRQTLEHFYQPFAATFSEISLLEQQGLLQGDRAWDMIVTMTEHVADWAFSEENYNANLLIHREMLFPSGMLDEAMDQIQVLFLYYEKLFEAFTQVEHTSWVRYLAFNTVTGFFDAANYPQFLGKLLGIDLALPENRALVKAQVKNSTLTSLRANLRQYVNC